MAERVDVLPRWVDPFKMAEHGASLEGGVPASHLSRLDGAGLTPVGDAAHVNLGFERHPEGFTMVRLGVRAEMRFTCQRCLGDAGLEVDRRSEIAVAVSPQDEQRLSERYDTALATEGRLDVHALVEDEILLAVPDIPMHGDPGDCDREMLAMQGGPGDDAPVGESENPFEVLKQWRDRKD